MVIGISSESIGGVIVTMYGVLPVEILIDSPKTGTLTSVVLDGPLGLNSS